MDFDIESTIQDNVRLKKALQMSKFSSDKMDKQFKQVKQLYEEQIQRNKVLKNDYCDLQRKYQQSYTESIRDNNSLISQIQELKKIIDEKQRDMEHIQIKLIPSLDQDMLRVKLITEMQGPYQQTVERKDRQIDKLKNKITELERNLQITTLSLKSKVQSLKKQNKEIKTRYEEESNKLIQQLNIALSRYEVQSVEASIIKNQKKQIQQLKNTIQFVTSSEQKQLQQIKELKQQRKNLLEKLMMFNSKQALLTEGRHNMTQIQKMKEERLRNQRQIESLKVEKEKLSRQLSKLDQDKVKLMNEHEKQINYERSKFTNQRNELNSEIYSLREEIRMLKSSKIEGESDRELNYQKIKTLQNDLYQRTKELQALRLQNSRFTQRGSEPGCWPGFFGTDTTQIEKKQKKDLKDRNQNQYTLINKNDKTNHKDQNFIEELERDNQKLKKKLAQANQKILALLKDKMKYAQTLSPQRERTQSNFQKPLGVFLQYEDCGFSPIVEPTLYTYPHRKL